jgi:hypothetical protein
MEPLTPPIGGSSDNAQHATDLPDFRLRRCLDSFRFNTRPAPVSEPRNSNPLGSRLNTQRKHQSQHHEDNPDKCQRHICSVQEKYSEASEEEKSKNNAEAHCYVTCHVLEHSKQRASAQPV